MVVSDTSFSARIARIEANRGLEAAPRNDAPPVLSGRGRNRRRSGLHMLVLNGREPLRIAVVFLIGVISAGMALSAAVNFGPVMPFQTMSWGMWIVAGVGGLLIALALGHLFQLGASSGSSITAAKLIGVGVGLSGMHNLAHWTPELATTLFGGKWVLAQLAQTEVNSLVLMAFTIQF
ncbi:hypothetical protein [Rhodovulum steppense]|uniref:Uncharacterized protein n=1 Tax=Rhodovulum steppense TaxID=540251 RepID=A0A4V2R378_9RHOB|nr:hypothetical protein [Rhodovulum steppense]TCM75420.1 hypothetical protein EV216_1398 [Rhodovulum steppense]